LGGPDAVITKAKVQEVKECILEAKKRVMRGWQPKKPSNTIEELGNTLAQIHSCNWDKSRHFWMVNVHVAAAAHMLQKQIVVHNVGSAYIPDEVDPETRIVLAKTLLVQREVYDGRAG